MSQYLTHIAVQDDCRRLALESDLICEPIKQALSRYPEISRLGSSTRGGGDFVIPLLDKYRKQWEKEWNTNLEKRLAFVLGWHTHRAADRLFKTIYRQLDHGQDSTHHIRVYHDLFIFDEVYGGGTREPFSTSLLEAKMQSHPCSEVMDIEHAEHLFEAKWIQDLIQLHLFIDNDIEIKEWLNKLIEKRQYYRIDHMSVYESPDPNKIEKFIKKPNFYDTEDPIIRLVRSIQKGEPDSTIDINSALEEAMTGSQYARTLNLGFTYLYAASEFIENEISKHMLKYRLHLSPMPLFEGEFSEHDDIARGKDSLLESKEDQTNSMYATSNPLTSIAIAEDCRQLSLTAENLADPIATCLQKYANAARIGCMTQIDEIQISHILEDHRSPGRINGNTDLEKLAFILGSLFHSGARMHIELSDNHSSNCQTDCDAIILRELTIDDNHFVQIEPKLVNELFTAFWRRALLRLHTLNPDRNDIEGWMDRLFELMEKNEVLLDKYSNTMSEVENDIDSNFYNQTDPIIQAARLLQQNKPLEDKLADIIDKKPTSRYAHAVTSGCQNLIAANEYLRGSINKTGLNNKLTI